MLSHPQAVAAVIIDAANKAAARTAARKAADQ
jgi:hypothetical protein